MGAWSLIPFAYHSEGVPMVPALMIVVIERLGGMAAKALSISEEVLVAMFMCVCASIRMSIRESNICFHVLSCLLGGRGLPKLTGSVLLDKGELILHDSEFGEAMFMSPIMLQKKLVGSVLLL